MLASYNRTVLTRRTLGLVKVHKIGGSLMVSIPADIARRLELHEGDDVAVREDAGMVIVEPARSLRELLASWEPLGPPGVMSDVVALIREDRETH
jgi:AbrB family looped-hinge helix DNA binding protein